MFATVFHFALAFSLMLGSVAVADSFSGIAEAYLSNANGERGFLSVGADVQFPTIVANHSGPDKLQVDAFLGLDFDTFPHCNTSLIIGLTSLSFAHRHQLIQAWYALGLSGARTNITGVDISVGDVVHIHADVPFSNSPNYGRVWVTNKANGNRTVVDVPNPDNPFCGAMVGWAVGAVHGTPFPPRLPTISFKEAQAIGTGQMEPFGPQPQDITNNLAHVEAKVTGDYSVNFRYTARSG